LTILLTNTEKVNYLNTSTVLLLLFCTLTNQHNETRHTARHTLRLSTYRASTTVAPVWRLYIRPPDRLNSWEL